LRVTLSPITAPLDELTFEPIKEALAPNGQGPPLHIIGLGVFDSTRGLLRFDAIHDVSRVEDPADLEAVDSRLDELEGLRGGWLEVMVLHRLRPRCEAPGGL
jgi:hypothetical protein